MRVKFKVESYLSSTSAGSKDIANGEWSYETSDKLISGNCRTFIVADDTTDEAVDLAGITDVRYIVLRTDQNIQLTINGTSDINVYVPTGFDFGYFIATLSGLTGLTVSNSSGESATITIHLSGDL